ncbi:MAG: methyltransferase domain-containing protein [Solirubrobacterales bacterium]|nr:methyltransferase domain-containing protein [Solirubrobacterales bacterium]
MDELDAMKERSKAVWAMGDYPEVARRFEGVAEALVAGCAIGPGMAVLDVAAGNGNVAVAAARAGASVTAADFTPELVAAGEARTAGMDVRWDVADAEDLPYDDDAFDVVLSVFGIIFAPRPEVAIAEAFRVVRPGGLVGICAWTPSGYNGRFTAAMASLLPASTGPSPDAWGDEATARARLAPHAEEIAVLRGVVPWEFASVGDARDWQERNFGAMQAVRAQVGEERYAEVRRRLDDLAGEYNVADDGSLRIEAEYLQVVAVAS